MDEFNRVKKSGSYRSTNSDSAAHKTGARRKSPWMNVIIAAVGLIVLLSIIYGASVIMKRQGPESTVDKNKYQAIFLTNNQVYFGKINEINKDYIKMSDIYYLQVQQSVQPKDQNSQQQLSLAKLGSELHGPEDKMMIARSQVLFWENLKDDGKVVQAIKQNQQSK